MLCFLGLQETLALTNTSLAPTPVPSPLPPDCPPPRPPQFNVGHDKLAVLLLKTLCTCKINIDLRREGGGECGAI